MTIKKRGINGTIAAECSSKCDLHMWTLFCTWYITTKLSAPTWHICFLNPKRKRKKKNKHPVVAIFVNNNQNAASIATVHHPTKKKKTRVPGKVQTRRSPKRDLQQVPAGSTPEHYVCEVSSWSSLRTSTDSSRVVTARVLPQPGAWEAVKRSGSVDVGPSNNCERNTVSVGPDRHTFTGFRGVFASLVTL